MLLVPDYSRDLSVLAGFEVLELEFPRTWTYFGNATRPRKRRIPISRQMFDRSCLNRTDDESGPDQYSMNSDTPLVSVVIPTYDRPDRLLGAVESVLKQTYEPIEVLVVDDHSPTPVIEQLDGELSRRFDRGKRLQIVRHEENRGANSARNTGIRESTGNYVAFLDDDDRWCSEKVERQVQMFARSSDSVGVVYTGVWNVDGAGKKRKKIVPSVSGKVTKQLLTGSAVAGSFSRVMVRSSVIEEAGLPDEQFPSWQDREWYIRLSLHCEFEYVAEPLTVRVLSEHDQISGDFEAKRDVTFPLFVEKHRDLAAEYGPAVERRFIADRTKAVGTAGLRAGEYSDALRFLSKSIRLHPTDLTPYLYLVLGIGGPRLFRATQRIKRMKDWIEL